MSAIEVLLKATKEEFKSVKEVQMHLCVMFHHGKNEEGYWNYAHTAVQFEDTVDIAKVLFPNHDLDFFFDQSSGHKKLHQGGLNVKVMNKSFAGKQLPMRDTKITAGCLGPFNAKLKIGDTQSFKVPFKKETMVPFG